jgi:transcription elongation factor GreB
MSQASTPDNDADDDDEAQAAAQQIPAGSKNYITASGYERLRSELLQLVDRERPEVVRTVQWAASNGDRSENADYIYGKRRMREIDRRIRFLTRRMDTAEIVDPAQQVKQDQIFFGATVTYAGNDGESRTITIVGIDEADPASGLISWIAPIARALLKARVGDVVQLRAPSGNEELEVIEISYPKA